jgi:hypothetical protein
MEEKESILNVTLPDCRLNSPSCFLCDLCVLCVEISLVARRLR